MGHERDEFAEKAALQMIGDVIIAHRREEPFLKATTSGEWTTLDGLVSALDAAGYWLGQGWSDFKPPEEPPDTPAGKRKHVRGMLEHLASYRDDDDFAGSAAKVFVGKLAATDDGGLARVYKVAALCSREELQELGEDHEALGDYHHSRGHELGKAAARLRRGEGGLSLPDFYMQELTEETMRLVWPNLDEERRGWVVAVGIKLKSAKARLMEDLRCEHKEGAIPTVEQVHEHLRRGVDGMWHEVAADLAARMEWSEDEAKRFVDQPAIRFYSSEFAEALENSEGDDFGWTLDEHLRFIADERELD